MKARPGPKRERDRMWTPAAYAHFLSPHPFCLVPEQWTMPEHLIAKGPSPHVKALLSGSSPVCVCRTTG